MIRNLPDWLFRVSFACSGFGNNAVIFASLDLSEQHIDYVTVLIFPWTNQIRNTSVQD
jgi:hypothetical protein